MMDRESVIKGLEYAWEYIRERPNPTATPKAMAMAGIKKAIDLMKEQEPVEPEVEFLNEIDRLYRCPKCHKHFFYRKQRFCDQCGQAVKWNEID